MNLPDFGSHLGADFWSGGGCTDLGQTVYAVADGTVVEIVDGLGSYLDVVVIEHDDPDVGTVYSMYGHIARDAGLVEGANVALRDPIGTIDDVLAYFSPCHLHFEILSQVAYDQGPFCNGCAGAGYNVSPGYDQQVGVSMGMEPSGDSYLEVNDGIDGNRWYFVDPFIAARVDAQCGRCGDGSCGGGESYDNCPEDCPPCALIPPEGGTLDEAGPCFSEGGDPQYWNYENGVGEGGTLQWTHTTDSRIVDNYGVWDLAFAEAGEYRLEVHIPAGTADTQLASYAVMHAGVTEALVVDQSTANGWVTVADLQFAEGGAQSVRLDDNTGEPFSGMTRIVFDAVRVTRLDPDPGGTGSTGGADDGTADGASAGDDDDDDDNGGGTLGGATSAGDGGDATGGVTTLPFPGGADDDSGACACRGKAGGALPPALLLLILLGVGTRRSSSATPNHRG